MLRVLRRLSRSRLRAVAVLFMVPVVILSTPNTAAAAGGAWQQVRIDMAVLGSQDWVGRDCTFNARNTGTAIEVGSAGYCTGLPDSSPGGLQPAEAGSSFVLTFDGADASSGSCGATYGGTLGPHSLNGTMRVAGSIPAGSGTITGGSSDGTCVVTEVCVRLMDTEFVCVSATLTPPEPTEDLSGECQYGTIAAPEARGPAPADYSPPAGWLSEQYTGKVAVTGKTGSTTTGKWVMYVVNVGQTGHYGIGPQINLAGYNGTAGGSYGAAAILYDYQSVTPGLTLQMQRGEPIGRFDWTGNGAAPPFTPKTRPIGFGVFYVPSGDVAGSLFTTAESTALVGKTNPAWCAWYWGDKIAAANPSYPDVDQPLGIIPTGTTTPEPEPEPEVVQPVPIPEPETEKDWLGMIWAVLVTIANGISAIVSGIASLAGKIVTGIVNGVRDMLEGLFVPDDTYLETKWSGVENKWEGTSPGRYLGSLDDFSSGTVSGCGGLPLNVQLGPGVSINENIGAACSGTMANVAGITRAVITAVFAVGGCVACVRAVGSGLGWDPGIGRGGVS